MKYFVFFLVILLTLSACPEITDGMENLDPRIYMAGSYREGNTQQACYWVKGHQINLDTPIGLDSAANAIVVKNGTVYAAGTYTDWYSSPRKPYTPCFWVNGKRRDLAVPDGVDYAIASDIAVSGAKVYIAGYYYCNPYAMINNDDTDDTVACYWIDGERIDMVETDSRVFAIAIRNDQVYMTGVYKDGYTDKSCLWINGTKTDLDTFLGRHSTDIYLSDDKTYVAGITAKENRYQASYWIDGIQTDLSIADIHSSPYVSAITVSNGKVYTAGGYYSNSRKEKRYYSVDETIFSLNIPDAPIGESAEAFIYDIAVLDNKVYTAGYYYIGAWATDGAGFHGRRSACYWIDGIRTDLSADIKIYAITIAS